MISRSLRASCLSVRRFAIPPSRLQWSRAYTSPSQSTNEDKKTKPDVKGKQREKVDRKNDDSKTGFPQPLEGFFQQLKKQMSDLEQERDKYSKYDKSEGQKKPPPPPMVTIIMLSKFSS